MSVLTSIISFFLLFVSTLLGGLLLLTMIFSHSILVGTNTSITSQTIGGKIAILCVVISLFGLGMYLVKLDWLHVAVPIFLGLFVPVILGIEMHLESGDGRSVLASIEENYIGELYFQMYYSENRSLSFSKSTGLPIIDNKRTDKSARNINYDELDFEKIINLLMKKSDQIETDSKGMYLGECEIHFAGEQVSHILEIEINQQAGNPTVRLSLKETEKQRSGEK